MRQLRLRRLLVPGLAVIIACGVGLLARTALPAPAPGTVVAEARR